MKKFIYNIVLLLICFVSFNISSAQTVATSTAPQDPTGSSRPDVYISSVAIETDPIVLGANINGSFLIDNLGNYDITSLYYRLYLVGDYDTEGNPQTVYDEVNFPAIFLKAGESLYERFSYILPMRLPSADVGIMIKAFLPDDTAVGFHSTRVVVKGEIVPDSVEIQSGFVTVNGVEFGLESGPTLAKGDVAILHLDIQSSESALLSPRIEVYKQNDRDNVLVLDSFEPIVLEDDEVYRFDEMLPSFDEGGVYVGTVTFVDSDGDRHGGLTRFRYIQSGDAGSITSVSSSVYSVVEGGAIDIVATYVGVPFDIARFVRPEVGEAELDIALYNEQDQNVGQSRQTINLDDSNGRFTTSIIAIDNAAALRAEAKIIKDGEIIASLETNLSPEYDELKSASTGKPKYMIDDAKVFMIVGLVMLVATLVSIAVAFWRKKASVAVLIIAFGVMCSVGIVSAQTSPTFYNSKTSNSEMFPPPNVSVNIPTFMLPNQPFTANVEVTSWACNNRSSNIETEVIFNNVRKTFVQKSTDIMKEIKGDSNHVIFPLDKSSSMGFTAPSTPGDYLFYVASRESFINNGRYEGDSWTVKHYNITVTRANADRCPNIPGVQGKLPRNVFRNTKGDCVPTDLCPNIPGEQKAVPGGFIVSGGICVVDDGKTVPDPEQDPDGGDGNDGDEDNSCNIYSEWQCSGWGKCVNGTRTRSCTHECNNKALKPKPAESESCSNNQGSGGIQGPGIVCPNPSPDGSCPIPAINSFKMIPSLVMKGGACTMRWNIAGATECNVSGGSVSGPITPSADGQKSTGPLSTSTKFTLMCSNGSSAPVNADADCLVQDVEEQ